jgi:glycosyltransferase involved in cell wall biosynthesis
MAEKVARSTFIGSISHYAASQIMKASEPQYWHKVHVLPLGVDPNAFRPRPQPSNRAEFQCVCVGRLAPAKAHLILFAAIGRLVEQGRTNIRLTVVGGGPAQASLEAAVASGNLGRYIRLVGACNHDRVLEYYREADIFTLASFAEGVPVVLMEAMAMEIPCVTTWITGVPELIRADVDGILVPPADPETLAAAIARLMDDPELCVRLGRSARMRVQECYDLERNTGLLAQEFRRYLLPGHPAAAEERMIDA